MHSFTTNYQLLQQLANDGRVWTCNIKPAEPFQEPVKVPVPAVDLEDYNLGFVAVVAEYEGDYDTGHTHFWKLQEPIDEPCMLNLPSPARAVTAYEATDVYGGPEEGGWWWTAARPIAVFLQPYGGYDESLMGRLRSFARTMADDENDDLSSGQRRCGYHCFVREEVVIGTATTVGSVYYC